MKFIFFTITASILSAPAFGAFTDAQKMKAAQFFCNQPEKDGVILPEKLLQRYGIQTQDVGSMCPHQKEVDANNACSGNAHHLIDLGKKWLDAHKATCAQLKASTDGATSQCSNFKDNSCQSSINGTMTAPLKQAIDTEIGLIKKIKGELKQMRENIDKDSVKPTADTLSQAEQSKDTAPPPAAGSVNAGNVASNAGDWKQKNGDQFASDVTGAAEALKAMQDSQQAMANIVSPYAKEPLGVMASANDFDKELDAQLNKLSSTSSGLGSQGGQAQSNSAGMNSDNKSASAPDNSGGGGGSGLSGGDAAQMASAAGGLAGGGGGGGGVSGGSTYTGATAATPSSPLMADTGSSGSNANLQKPTVNAKPSGSSGDVSVANSSGASTAPSSGSSGASSDLRDRLRASLANGDAAGGGNASVSPNSAAADAKKATGVPNAMLAKGTGDDMGSFGAHMGGIDGAGFPMAGSETDSAVRNLVNDFQGATGGGRSLASTTEGAQESILDAETPSLFSRTHDTHRRCILRGLVTAGGHPKG